MVDLRHGDCLELMKDIPDGSVDLVLTDPPYGKKADKGTNGFGSVKNRRYGGGWDSQRPSKEIFDEMLRIGKNVIIFGGNYFADMLPPSNHWIFWDKKGDIAFQNPFADGELIYTTFKKPIKRIVFKQQGFIRGYINSFCNLLFIFRKRGSPRSLSFSSVLWHRCSPFLVYFSIIIAQSI